MNYLSFDVGIKNLAYCELTPQKKIKQWGIINMNSNPTCSMCLKKPCDKQASHSLTIDGKVNYNFPIFTIVFTILGAVLAFLGVGLMIRSFIEKNSRGR